MSTVLETYTPAKAGYFRIGHLSLVIPPEQIITQQVTNADELMALRAKFPQILKTGQARWDVTIRWKALQKDWEDVRTILAMFKAAPFVEIENEHVRAVLAQAQQDSSYTYRRLAMGLRQLRIESSPDIIDALDLTLTMTLFNFLPYSRDFGYRGDQGQAVDALYSEDFKSYIKAWKDANLLHPIQPSGRGCEIDDPRAWTDQPGGQISFNWRYYEKFSGSEVVRPSVADPDGDTAWGFDHHMGVPPDDYSFWFTQKKIVIPGSDTFVNTENLYATGVAVVFVNNLAQIPLANHQYPTYQHIGPAGSMVSIGFLSGLSGDRFDPYSSPGISEITRMMRRLEDQFLAHRTDFRSSTSVQRMQAFKVENQILNMLGIFALQAKSFNSVTMEEQVGTQVSLLAAQYENVFEEEDPYHIRGSARAYANVLKGILSTDALGNLPQNEQDALSPLMVFQQAQARRDTVYLSRTILANLSGINAAYPEVDFPRPLTPQMNASLLAAAKSLQSTQPVLAATIAKHQQQITYTDYFMLNRLGKVSPALASQVDSLLQGKDLLPDLFSAVFDDQLANDKPLSRAADLLVNSPGLGQQFRDALPINGPGGENPEHGAYRDLGLSAVTLGARDWNPGYYFRDDGKDVYDDIWKDMKSQVNQLLAGSAISTPTSEAVAVNLDQGMSPNNPFGIMQRAHFPGFNMGQAFPTFKLFLVEEDNSDFYYAFDSFYSYSSVTGIEIIRYRDKPDTALLQITNLASLFNKKMYDNSSEGKYEQEHSNALHAPIYAGGETTTGPNVTTQVSAGRDRVTGQPGLNLTPGWGENTRVVPLRYYGLQTGSKIQIRLGFANNPDALTPVFTGLVTQLDEQDGIMNIMAQSHMLELQTVNDDDLEPDGWSVLGILGDSFLSLENAALDVLSSPPHPLDALRDFWGTLPFHRSPAFGSWKIFGNDAHGDAGTVIAAMLKSAGAKHFGHWQVGQVRDPYLKGFTWNELVAPSLTSGSVLAIAQTQQDRSADNILINQLIGANGTLVTPSENTSAGGLKSLKRSYTFESNFLVGATYHIQSGVSLAPWQVIADVARRYPEYVLAVKQFGYPFEVNSTLVFAHPLDWYYARWPMPVEQVPIDDVRDGNFFWEWWTSGTGSTQASTLVGTHRQQFIDYVDRLFVPVFGTSLFAANQGEIYAAQIDASRSAVQFQTILNSLVEALTAVITKTSVGVAIRVAPGLFPKGRPGDPVVGRNALNSLENGLQAWLKMRRTNSFGQIDNSDRVKPVRRFHFVNDTHIIHNSIALNEKIFNTVKVGGEKFCANDFIPAQYRRMLDCNGAILYPEKNVTGQNVAVRVSYGQSFLREEVGKMYRGDLVLRGVPEIEPFDIVMLADASTGTLGPVEVDSVIHSFDQDAGYVTIVKPRAVVTINEAATANLIHSLAIAWSKRTAIARSAASEFENAIANLGKDVQGVPGAQWLAGPTFGGAVRWAASVIGRGALLVQAAATTKLETVLVLPLTRFGQPWLGGLEGYRMGDVAQFVHDQWRQFYTYELAPTIDSYRTALQLVGGASSLTTGPLTRVPAVNGRINLPQNISDLIDKYALQFQVDANIAKALAFAESSGNALARAAGSTASGVFQLTRGTAAALGVTNVFDPEQNVRGGIQYLADQLKTFNGDYKLAIAAYHDGPGAVKKGQISPDAQQEVGRVLALAGFKG